METIWFDSTSPKLTSLYYTLLAESSTCNLPRLCLLPKKKHEIQIRHEKILAQPLSSIPYPCTNALLFGLLFVRIFEPKTPEAVQFSVVKQKPLLRLFSWTSERVSIDAAVASLIDDAKVACEQNVFINAKKIVYTYYAVASSADALLSTT